MGGAVDLYNRTFHIHACDAFTRKFMQDQGHPQVPDGEAPQDPYHHHLQQKQLLVEEAKGRVHAHEKPADSKYYLENARKVQQPTRLAVKRLSRHGMLCAHAPCTKVMPTAPAVQVLRFYACWDDSRRPFGDKMPFVIHYFLADHTMEVGEVRLRNDGRDPFPLLVRRMPIPKKVRTQACVLAASSRPPGHLEAACALMASRVAHLSF